MQSQARDIYRDVTDRIIAAIETGAGTWHMPWHRTVSRPTNVRSGRPYSGVNVLALWAAAELGGFGSGFWGTYRQWQELGAQVRRKEKASLIVFYKQLERQVEKAGELETRSYFFARASWVFNADQVDGWSPPTPAVRNPAEALEGAEIFVAATRADVRHGGEQAYYNTAGDYIAMPARERFVGTATSSATEGYYATLLHELTHWTAHGERLDRNLSGRFGDEAYAMEELVAELGGAFLCADLAITNTPRPDHAAYLASWLSVLKRDGKAIFSAARRASEAAEYLASFSRGSQANV